MSIGRTVGACVMAVALAGPSLAMPQEVAPDLSPFVPPPCVAGQEMFTDVPASNPFCPWIEQLARDHVTGGCAPQLFCPTAPLTRQQMSAFLELAMRGTDTWIVNADLLDGMDSTDFVTGVNAGTGLSGGGSGGNLSIALAPSFQLPQTCAGGQHAEWTGAAWTCGNPGTGTVTSVGTGTGLTGGPITTTGTIAVAPGGITSAMIADGTVGSADVADGSIGAADVASAQVQLRVAPPCAAGQFVRAVNADGTPVCAADADSGGTVTSVATGAGLTGGPITGAGTISVAPNGITGAMIADGTVGAADIADGSIGSADIADGGVGAADVASAQVQLRVAAACAAGQSIRVVNADGTVACETDDDAGGTVTSVATGAGLTGGPITGAGTISVAVGGITGALIGDGTVSGADIADGSIAAGDVNSAQVQLRVSQACATSQFMRAVNADGTVTCAGDANHDHFGQSWTGGVATPGLSVQNSTGVGVFATSAMAGGVAVRGESTGGANSYGLLGLAASSTGRGVAGVASSATGSNYGVQGISSSTGGKGVSGEATATTGFAYGVYGTTPSTQGVGVRGEATASTGTASGVFGTSVSTSGMGLRGDATASSGLTYGVFAHSASPDGRGVRGNASAPDGQTHGVSGGSLSTSGIGVAGFASASTGTNMGVYGFTGSPDGYAGYFSGRVLVNSHLSVIGNLLVSGTKAFKIDHPLDPANRYLVHSAIESDQMLNMYSGTVVLDADGAATVRLPEWFEALNRDFRYQLTCIGGYAPVYIASEIQGGRFGIAGGRAGLKVSWQVVGTRSDKHALAHPMVVDEEKPAGERGTYLDPEAHGQPPELARDYKVTSAISKE